MTRQQESVIRLSREGKRLFGKRAIAHLWAVADALIRRNDEVGDDEEGAALRRGDHLLHHVRNLSIRRLVRLLRLIPCYDI